MSSNEFRSVLGFKPDKTNPNSDKLVNSNMPQPNPPSTTAPTNMMDQQATPPGSQIPQQATKGVSP